MKRTNIYLAEGQAAALDRVAGAAGVSRAEVAPCRTSELGGS
jgi:hypothetical protein